MFLQAFAVAALALQWAVKAIDSELCVLCKKRRSNTSQLAVLWSKMRLMRYIGKSMRRMYILRLLLLHQSYVYIVQPSPEHL
jgi:hypothetical protein